MTGPRGKARAGLAFVSFSNQQIVYTLKLSAGGWTVYGWDETKRRANLAKHGVDFAEVENFDWETARFVGSETVDHEQREIVLGLIEGYLYALCYTERGETVRIISLRRAKKHEERAFHEA